jgi:glycosyltransferase involved in cell wall biosynthesis
MAEPNPRLPLSAHGRISIVMPVHNALPYLDEAVESILAQTHRDFEFVIFDDGSTDGSAQRLRQWAEKDKRIRLHESKRNLGPVGSSNAVVELAGGSLIARMDADDISHPERLRRELEVFAERPGTGLVGSLYEIIDDRGRKLRSPEVWRIRPNSWFPPFPHGSIMYRRELFERIGGYRRACEFWEDHDFALRMAAEADVLIIPEALYKHRQSYLSTRVASDQARVERAVDLMYRSIDNLAGNRSYDEVLGAGPTRDERVDPRVFIALGSLTLWANGKPRLFRRLLRTGRLKPNARTFSALAWTAWASASPASLRAFLSLLVRGRNRMASGRVGGGGPMPWQPPKLELLRGFGNARVAPDDVPARAARGAAS